MKAFFSTRWSVALRVTACILVILACQLPFLNTQPAGVPPTPGANGGSTTQATAGAPAGSTPETTPAGMVFGPGPFRLMDPTVGLADLSSYNATLTISFNGTQAGQSSQWSHTYVMMSSKQSAAHQITIESAGGVPAPVFMLEMNGVSYELDEEKNCTASTIVAGSSLTATWEPAGFLSGLIGAEGAGSETVNGMASNKYTFDERALGESGFTQSTGQVWVAKDNGVVVRYLLTTTAGVDYFGEGIEGVQTWEYNLTEVNQPVTFDLPAGCPGGLVNAPLMPAAQTVRRLPGVTTYSIMGSIQDVLAFYQAQLPALGWAATGEPSVADTMGWVGFVQSNQQLSVIVTPLENMVEVRLVIGPAISQ
ncbi:MAG TPA: hypothetical protein VF359_05915 [Anaerolineales bacterium]